ncbi:MAG TPA: L-histidine N(alpha)-methyltransferase [Solirubrobacteraceae bacterium]
MRQLLDTESISITSCLSESDERCLAEDVLDGLTRPFKELPPKHFYDAKGSELFERICELPEYYPTRTERLILERNAEEIVRHTGAGELVELGSGSAEKARILLEAMADADTLRRYVPLDVSGHALQQAAEELVDEYEGLQVDGVIGDFERHLDSIPGRDGEARLIALLGGTIGNFPPGTRRRLLRTIAGLLGPDDRLLLGTDLVKDPEVIEAAYDDEHGVTAEFNRNVLSVINRELDADFSPDAFDHVAFYDREHEWVEMRLRARRAHSVLIARLGLRVAFAAGEELRTEISAKFSRARLEADLKAAGLTLDRWYTDPQDLFAVSLAARR